MRQINYLFIFKLLSFILILTFIAGVYLIEDLTGPLGFAINFLIFGTLGFMWLKLTNTFFSWVWAVGLLAGLVFMTYPLYRDAAYNYQGRLFSPTQVYNAFAFKHLSYIKAVTLKITTPEALGKEKEIAATHITFDPELVRDFLTTRSESDFFLEKEKGEWRLSALDEEVIKNAPQAALMLVKKELESSYHSTIIYPKLALGLIENRLAELVKNKIEAAHVP